MSVLALEAGVLIEESVRLVDDEPAGLATDLSVLSALSLLSGWLGALVASFFGSPTTSAEVGPVEMPRLTIKNDAIQADRMMLLPLESLLAAPAQYKALPAPSLEFSTEPN